MQAMLPATSPRKKMKSPGQDIFPNPKTTITCTNVPESLFEPNAASKHFSKFGRVHRIRLFPKKHACMIEYDQPSAIERAVLNAGAYDGFMFDVTRTKARVRKRSKREDDPDWVPDPEVANELSAMRGAPTYQTRNKSMDTESAQAAEPEPVVLKRVIKQTVRRTQPPLRQPLASSAQQTSGMESPVIVTTQTTLSTLEAALELHQLRSKISLSPDEQWRTLDARDRILRSWGGAGSRVKVGGATIGTCQDMCPEKELLHRQAEHQVMVLETDQNSEGVLDPRRAVKQYSRSSADQEIPMCYELRPAPVLMKTCSYLLHEVADTTRQISLADWFHFMWDRLRGIRKDITQQALCCAESICLVEMCARFHAHCAARLADLELTQFDQKLNTDNLTKCLQTLKHMYADVTPQERPREAEFRGYIALLNLGDANFWWEIKQLPEEIQKSEPIIFAIKVFNALDNNNYVRFFRLVRDEATYLQACILLRYFNDVRARALARIVKAYAPRGGSRFPASDLVNALAFESVDRMKAFINHYGLRFAKSDDYELSVILDRNQFIEDSDPFPTARAIQLIESKRQSTVGEVIAGGQLPNADYFERALHVSFNKDGRLKETALVAEEQGFNTINDSNKNVQALKSEIQRLAQGGKSYGNTEMPEPRVTQFAKADIRTSSPKRKPALAPPSLSETKFTFKPAITVAPVDIIKNSPEKSFETEDVFLFSKPQITEKDAASVLTPFAKSTTVFGRTAVPSESKGIFGSTTKYDTSPFQSSQNAFGNKINSTSKSEAPKSSFRVGSKNVKEKINESPFSTATNVFKRSEIPRAVFGENVEHHKNESSFSGEKKSSDLFANSIITKSVFGSNVETKSVFGSNVETKSEPSLFGIKPQQFNDGNIFASARDSTASSKPDSASQFGKGTNLFAKAATNIEESSQKSNIFANTLRNTTESQQNTNIFAKPAQILEAPNKGNSIFGGLSQNTAENKQASNIFVKSIQPAEDNSKSKSIFGAVNKTSESRNIFTPAEVGGQQKTPSIFTSNGDIPNSKTPVTPGSLFKSVVVPPNGDSKGYSIFQSKNKAQTVADNIFNSVNTAKNDTVYEFNQNTEIDEQHQMELQRLREEKIKQEEEQKRREQEAILRKEEEKRQAELRKQEEEKQKAEALRKQEQLRLLEEKRILEERKKQEELKKKLEEERKAELKRKAEEEHRKFLLAVETESTSLVEELITEVNDEISREMLREENENYRQLLNLTANVTEELLNEMCDEVCSSEMKAEFFLTNRIMRKWFDVWRKHYIRNVKRRKWLDDTPVWLPERSPIDQAAYLRRSVEDATLQYMKAFHRGYTFSGELRQFPPPDPYNIMEIIRSPLLKRMKQISYPYDKCFYWKLTLVSPDKEQWLYRKINIEKWLHDAFSDKKNHEESETLIHVAKQSWNHLMDFAISVSLATRDNMNIWSQAIEGTNAVLFFSTEKDNNLVGTIEQTLKHRYPYQIVPVAIIMPKLQEPTQNIIQSMLTEYVSRKIISGYKIFVLDDKNINDILNLSTKRALKWMAKMFPETPPIEIDFLKSICQRYLGNEIWCRFKIERDSRMRDVLKDIQKLITCYNVAVDKLTDIITNEDLFNYTSFPLELKPYLEQSMPYPKPYEFIPSNVRTSENTSAIKDLMKELKLPNALSAFKPLSASSMHQQIRTYCNQIGWFEDPEEVVCKVVAVLPSELSDLEMPREDFAQHFSQYDLIDFLNVIVYEKISKLNRFDNRFAIYEKSVLQEYCNINWLYEVKVISQMKHRAIDFESELDTFIQAKRRKLALDSLEYLMLEDKDTTMVEESIQAANADISKYSNCTEAIKQLENEMEEGRKKSVEFENMLRAALADV